MPGHTLYHSNPVEKGMGSDLGERLEIKDKCKKESRYLGLKIVFDIKNGGLRKNQTLEWRKLAFF